MSTYTLISSDSHIIEPPDLWTQRIDRAFTARAPCLIHEAEADQWYADGVTFGAIGINQQAGVRFDTPEALTLQGRMATLNGEIAEFSKQIEARRQEIAHLEERERVEPERPILEVRCHWAPVSQPLAAAAVAVAVRHGKSRQTNCADLADLDGLHGASPP